MRRSRKETDLAASSDLSLLGVMRLPDGDRYRRMRVVEVEGKRERRRGISGFVLRERLAASFRVRLFRQLPILNAQAVDSVPHYNLLDRKLGINIIRSALTKPARTIAENAGEEGSVVVGELLSKHGENFNVGFNAATGEYQDMIKAGVLDPLKIVKGSLQNASGVASLLFTTEACVVDAPEEKGPAGGMPGGMPGMGGMGGF